MDREKWESVLEWWENADTDTRYAVIIGFSGALSLLLFLLESAKPTGETFHRVRIENP